ncbi:MAG: glycosyltransferase family 2 protein [Christensenellales bacterium]
MMDSAPLVSVRIPSYNHEKYIYDCISSVINQTYQNLEIVIVDDCSTDGTVNVIRQFNDQRIKLEVLKRNAGMNVAVERCMQLCSGKYAANLSSDDMWAETKLEKQVDFLEKNKEYDAVFTQVEFIGEDGNTIKDVRNKYARIFDYENRDASNWLRRFFYQGNCLCNPSVMIRRDVYQSLNYQDKRLVSMSDFDLWVRFSFDHRLWILDEKLTKFRIRSKNGNLSADTPGNRNRSIFEYKQILDHFLAIRDPRLFVEIFPESLNFGQPKEIAIPYFLGRLAIDAGPMFKRLWGCEKIFALMSDNEAAAFLEEYYDFRYADFLRLTKTTDFFNILNTEPSRFSVKCGNALKRVSPGLYKKIKDSFKS